MQFFQPNDDTNILGAIATVRVYNVFGQLRTQEVAIRIDGRGDTFRVDRHTIGPWESIDDGEGVATLREAKALARAFVRAVRKQRRLDPTLPRREAQEAFSIAA